MVVRLRNLDHGGDLTHQLSVPSTETVRCSGFVSIAVVNHDGVASVTRSYLVWQKEPSEIIE